MKVFKTTSNLILFLLLTANAFSQGTLTPVTSFGTNPGALNMYYYVPTGITQPAALVLALHGCTQTASIYATQSGWNKLANRHKFIVVYPEQVAANNSSKCFNWFDATDQSKGQGEDLSIKQMVDYMKSHFSIDTTKIFVTGLSAGAGMTSVMLATYPKLFNKGAIMAGLPYKASSSSSTAFNAMNGLVTKTAAQWSTLVKNENPSYTGPFPHVAIFHGTTDATVNITNATELIKQWTDLNNADQTADATNSAFQGNSAIEQTIFNDNLNNPVVYYYKITGMGHGISLDTGSCPRQGGATGTYALEKNFHSTYWAAYFFGILSNPYSISGAIQVLPNASNVSYSVVNSAGSTYTWTVPTGATIVSGQGTNSILVNFSTGSGYVKVQETSGAGCINDIASIYVAVVYNVTVSQTSSIACHGAATASLSVTASGGSTPYTYSWSPSGGTNSSASGLAAGVYTITVTDHASVIVTSASFTITQPALISGSQTINLCAGQVVTVGGHTYNVTNTYVDTLNAANGCDSVLTTHLTVHALTPVSLILGGNDTLCSSNATFILSGGSPAGGIYSGQAVSGGSFHPATASIGWNVTTYTVIDGNNCSNKAKDSLYIKNCTSTGIDDLGISKNSAIYFSSETGSITILISNDNNSSYTLDLYTVFGQQVESQKIINGSKINTENLSQGIYICKVSEMNSVGSEKTGGLIKRILIRH